MTGHSLDWEKLGRYLAGESSPEEKAAVERWLAEHPSDAHVVAALDTATSNIAPAQPVDVEAALRSVKRRMHAPAAAKPARWRASIGLAAAVAVLIAVSLIARRTPSDSIRGGARQSFATAVGQRRDVRLRDGTNITLGPLSTLTVRGREATLAGEAFFDVVHDAERPFTVRADGAVIRDVGTQFTVHNDGSSEVRVVVKQGAVWLSNTRDSTTLAAGDVGVVEAAGRLSTRRGGATDDDLAWTLGRLVFRDVPISELSADLQRWYGVQLRVTDSALARRHFTGTFASEPPDSVLKVIGLALGARVERRGDTAYLRSTIRGR